MKLLPFILATVVFFIFIANPILAFVLWIVVGFLSVFVLGLLGY